MESSSAGIETGASVNLLSDAVREFRNILTDDQRTKLDSIGSIRDADSVKIFTEQLDKENQLKTGRSTVRRLQPVLDCVYDFASIVETFVSSHPEIAALVWGSIKLTLLVCCLVAAHLAPTALADHV